MEILAHLLDDGELHGLVLEWERTERGSLPNYVETVIILWQVLLAHTNIIYHQEALMGEIISLTSSVGLCYANQSHKYTDEKNLIHST